MIALIHFVGLRAPIEVRETLVPRTRETDILWFPCLPVCEVLAGVMVLLLIVVMRSS